jgi:hypothetical protein
MGVRSLVCLRGSASVQTELAKCKVAEQRKLCLEVLVGVSGTDVPKCTRADFEGIVGSRAGCLAKFLEGASLDENGGVRGAADYW